MLCNDKSKVSLCRWISAWDASSNGGHSVAGSDSSQILVPVVMADRYVLATQRREIEVVHQAIEYIQPPAKDGVGLEDTIAVPKKDGCSALIAIGKQIFAIRSHGVRTLVHVLLRRNGAVQRRMEIMVEVVAGGRHPRKGPAHSGLEWRNLAQRRARNHHQRGIA